jgi:hypothetical protein
LLIVRRRFERGAGLGIELRGQHGEEPYTVLAKVVHVQQRSDGSWALGCKFISELSEDELQRLMPPQPPKAVPAATPPSSAIPVVPSALLREGAAGEKALAEVQFQLELAQGRVINCRIRRLSVPGTWPLSAGKVLLMRVQARRHQLPPLQLETVRCVREGECWTLRCRLLSPSWDELLRTLRQPVR